MYVKRQSRPAGDNRRTGVEAGRIPGWGAADGSTSGERGHRAVYFERDQSVALTREIDVRRGVRVRPEVGVTVVAAANVNGAVGHWRRRWVELTVHSPQVLRVDEKAISPFARLEGESRADEDDARGAQVLVVVAPVALPVQWNESVFVGKGRGEPHDRVGLELRGALQVSIASARGAVAARVETLPW